MILEPVPWRNNSRDDIIKSQFSIQLMAVSKLDLFSGDKSHYFESTIRIFPLMCWYMWDFEEICGGFYCRQYLLRIHSSWVFLVFYFPPCFLNMFITATKELKNHSSGQLVHPLF